MHDGRKLAGKFGSHANGTSGSIRLRNGHRTPDSGHLAALATRPERLKQEGGRSLRSSAGMRFREAERLSNTHSTWGPR
ncbi:unnamed protein product, partial [Iphiclides podalirius]